MLPFRGKSPATQLLLMGGGLLALVGAEGALLAYLSSRSPASPPAPTSIASAAAPTPTEEVFTTPGTTGANPNSPASAPSAPAPGLMGGASNAAPPAPGASVPSPSLPALTLTNPLLSASATPKPGAPKGAPPNPQLARAAALFEQAASAIKSGDKKKAAALWEQVVKLAPTDAATRQNLVRVYQELKQPKAALPHAIAAARLTPKNPSAQYQLARLYLDLRQPKAALEPLRASVRLAPQVREGHTVLARVLVDLRQPKAALEQWTTLAQQNSHDVEAHIYAAAVANDLLRNPTEAQKWLRRSISQNPTDPQAPMALAQLLMARRDAKGAAAVLTQAVRTSPNTFGLYPALAEARVAAKDRSGAIGALQSALARVPKTGKGAAQVEAGLRLTLGQLYGDGKQTTAARDQFDLSAKLAPTNPEPLAMGALAEIQLRNFASANKLLSQAVALDPKNPRIRLLYAQTLAQNKQWKEADAQYQVYCASTPRDLESLGQWAQVARENKNLPRELELWQKLAKSAPKSPVVWAQLGAAELAGGHKREALAAYQKKMALTPRDLSAALQVADLQADLGEAAGALETFQQAVEARPDYAPAYVLLLQSGDAAKQQDSARNFVAQKLAAQPQNGEALKGVLKFYADKKRPDDARALLSTIVERNPQAALAKKELDSYASPPASSPEATKAP